MSEMIIYVCSQIPQKCKTVKEASGKVLKARRFSRYSCKKDHICERSLIHIPKVFSMPGGVAGYFILFPLPLKPECLALWKKNTRGTSLLNSEYDNRIIWQNFTIIHLIIFCLT